MFLLPPHRDVTVHLSERVVSSDVAAEFVAAWTAPTHLRTRATTSTPADAITLLACAQILERRVHMHARLRAMGRALSVQTQTGPVHVTLDDIALAGGTTRSSADAWSAAQEDALPWNGWVDEQLGRVSPGEPVELWVETDHSLPAALRIAAGTEGPLTLRGTFAERFFPVLHTLPPFLRARRGPQPELWVGENRAWKPFRAPVPGTIWSGYARLDELDCGGQQVVIPIVRVENEQVLDAHGLTAPLSALQQAKARGVTVIAELHVGAPGIDEAQARATLQALQSSGAIDWLAGVRPFHLQPAEAASWPGVSLGAVEARFDLERTVPFEAPNTCPASALEGLARDAAAIWKPAPSRVAAALVNPPATVQGGDFLALDDDAAVVDTIGPSGPGWYGVQLRTGTVLKLDARVAAPLAQVNGGATAGELFAALPDTQRAKARDALLQRNLLQQVRSRP